MTRNPRFTKRLLTAFTAGLALLGITERSQAQELYLTGPLAGAPAVRKLRLYRQTRFEIAPAVSFTLLDEYQRTILLGARLQFNFTDWLAIGGWGALGSAIRLPTALTENIQTVNEQRQAQVAPCNADPGGAGCNGALLTQRLTAVNLGKDLKDQLGGIDWVAAPQLTLTPLRGKLALFQSIYLDTDFYISAGPAFIGLTERANCKNCVNEFKTTSRMAIGSLVLGYYHDGALVHAGRVGTGFTAAVAAATLFSYVLFYTPLKTRTSLSTIVGAIPGALPAVIGWTAATNTLSIEGWVLFGIVFMWQMPHFLAIAWLFRDDYAAAGIPLLPVVQPDGRTTGHQAVLYSAALIPISFLPTAVGLATVYYMVGALVLGAVLIVLSLEFASTRGMPAAKRLFFGTILYLPLLWAVLLADHYKYIV